MDGGLTKEHVDFGVTLGSALGNVLDRSFGDDAQREHFAANEVDPVGSRRRSESLVSIEPVGIVRGNWHNQSPIQLLGQQRPKVPMDEDTSGST